MQRPPTVAEGTVKGPVKVPVAGDPWVEGPPGKPEVKPEPPAFAVDRVMAIGPKGQGAPKTSMFRVAVTDSLIVAVPSDRIVPVASPTSLSVRLMEAPLKLVVYSGTESDPLVSAPVSES